MISCVPEVETTKPHFSRRGDPTFSPAPVFRLFQALEEYLDVRVNLRLNVKVDKNWRRKKASLKEYGYLS